MKILHVIGGMDRGGAEMYIMNSLRNLDLKKYKFGIVTFIPSHSGGRYDFEDELEKMGVKIYRITDNRFKHPRRFIRDIAKIVYDDKYDTVHSHIDFMSALSLAGAKKGGATKRIAHSHGSNNEKLDSKIIRIISVFLRHRLNKLATHRLACGEAAGEFLYGKKQEFTVIHNGIDLQKFRFNANTRHKMREKCDFGEDDVILLNIGRLEKVKNHSRLIDIFGDYSRKHKNSHLIIIGDGSLHDDLEDKIASERLEDKITLLPAQADVERYYMMADIFVMPSLFEGVPTVGIEAQACGMKCLFSDTVPEETKLIDSSEFLSLNGGDWLSRIIPNETKKRGEAIKAPKVQEYDIKNTVKKLEAVYEA